MARYSLGDIATLLEAELVGDAAVVITAVASLSEAGPGQLSFLGDARYQKYLTQSRAAAVLITADRVSDCPNAALIVDNPSAKFAKIAKLFEHKCHQPAGIHTTAVIGEACVIDSSASVGAYCVLGNQVHIGKNTLISPGTVIGDEVIIGDDCIFYPRVTLYPGVKIGSRVIVHSGVVIGSDGFGNTQENGHWVKIPQLGCVLIGDDVEIGANTTIDRGALDDTVIEEGVRLDNLIQIGHNVRIGAHTAIAAHTGIAGSTRIGKQCLIGGRAAINGHISICDRVLLTGAACVSKSITEPGVYSSVMSVLKNRDWNKAYIRFKGLDAMYKRLLDLEKKVDE